MVGGSADYLAPQDTSLFDITSNTQSFTVELWMNPYDIYTSGGDAYRFTSIITKGMVYVNFGYESDGTIKFYTHDGRELQPIEKLQQAL